MPKMVVNEVMIIGRKRRRPASWIASIKGMPAFRYSFIASSFRIESLIIIPQVTTDPQDQQRGGHVDRNLQQNDQRLPEILELGGQDKIH